MGRVDIVLGDRHGAACADEIVSTLEELLRSQGLRVVRNKPYAGGFITQNYGRPPISRHALQIEINRACTWTSAHSNAAAALRAIRAQLCTACSPVARRPARYHATAPPGGGISQKKGRYHCREPAQV